MINSSSPISIRLCYRLASLTRWMFWHLSLKNERSWASFVSFFFAADGSTQKETISNSVRAATSISPSDVWHKSSHVEKKGQKASGSPNMHVNFRLQMSTYPGWLARFIQQRNGGKNWRLQQITRRRMAAGVSLIRKSKSAMLGVVTPKWNARQ